MRKIFNNLLTFVFVIGTISVADAQAVGSLSENFNVSCASASGFPSNWLRYNPIISTKPLGEWTCGPVTGRSGTPGIQCTGYYSSAYHLDTSFLITPLLNVSSYSGRVYLQFDSKTTSVHLGDRLSVILAHSPDSNVRNNSMDSNLTTSMLPVISNSDSSDWVTHVIDLTGFKGFGDFSLAFRYTSTATAGNIWYLDNISLTTNNMVEDPDRENINVTVLGNPAYGKVKISFPASPGTYKLSVRDILGRTVLTDLIDANSAREIYSIKQELEPGIYFIKIENEYSFGITKLVIQ